MADVIFRTQFRITQDHVSLVESQEYLEIVRIAFMGMVALREKSVDAFAKTLYLFRSGIKGAK
jgi:hypothetical protein